MKSKTIINSFFVLIGALAFIAATPAMADESVGTGKFVGKSKHETSGTATIVKTGDGYVLQLGSDFKFDGAPDPKLALGKGGYKKDTLISPLKKNAGAQTYKLPAGIDASQYDEVWVWCEKFNVPLGVAKLK